MTERFLPLAPEKPAKPVWRTWKWLGLSALAAVLILRPWLHDGIVAVGFLCGIIVLFNLAFLLFRYLKNRFFWRVRNRLLGSFVFVGLIPLIMILGAGYLSSYLLLGQLAATYLTTALSALENQVAEINVELSEKLVPGITPESFERLASRTLEMHREQIPRAAARLLKRLPDGGFETVARFDPSEVVKETSEYPGARWLAGQSTYQGLLRQDRSALIATLRPVPLLPDFYLDVTVPLDRDLEERLARERSIYAAFLGVGRTEVRVNDSTIQVNVGDQRKSADPETDRRIRVMESASRRDPRKMVTWGTLLDGSDYASGARDYIGFVVLQVPLEVLYKTYLAPTDLQGRLTLRIIYALIGLSVFAELVSMLVGLTISRRITRSVHDMYQGTMALQKGDLQYRIPVRRNDQLGLLAHSFNQMSAAITKLLEEVTEKKRLEQELEIAREVQATLFPKQLPHPRGMAVYGGCEPARVVSGDYYDFVVEDETRLHIVVGDISGKGISAALLMANLQAAMRSQLLSVKRGSLAEIEKSLSEVMFQLNQQIYLNSPAEKYATLFAARYDAESRRLCYSNAGHLAPILLGDGQVERMEATGTVLGLFPNMNYQSRTVELPPGAVLVIFTDGVTEAVNDQDEEFGEARLIQSLCDCRKLQPEEIYHHVVGCVRAWQGEMRQHDDITLIVGKAD